MRCFGSCYVTAVNNDFTNSPELVAITGYTDQAMEPSISRDDNYLFFNSLNDGVDTSLYYAQRGTDYVTFNSATRIDGVNGSSPHLDAVASMDTGDNFYWISTRNYITNPPADYRSVFTGVFSSGNVTGIQAISGDFYVESPGWIVMDAEISSGGLDLYFVNAFFSGGAVPDRSDIGVAHWDVDSTSFITDVNSSTIMQNINTNRCLEYAPSISADGLKLFFTRLDLCTTKSQILVAERTSTTGSFGAPQRIGLITGFVEAPSISADGNRLYYHRNDSGTYHIYVVSK